MPVAFCCLQSHLSLCRNTQKGEAEAHMHALRVVEDRRSDDEEDEDRNYHRKRWGGRTNYCTELLLFTNSLEAQTHKQIHKHAHKHTDRGTHLAHGGSSPSRYNSCFEPRRSGSPGTGGAWTAPHTNGHCSSDSVQWLPYKTPHRGWEKRRRKEAVKGEGEPAQHQQRNLRTGAWGHVSFSVFVQSRRLSPGNWSQQVKCSGSACSASSHLKVSPSQVRPWLTFSVRFLCFCLVLHLPVLDDCTSRLPAGKKEEKTNRCGESLLHPTLALLCLLIVSLFSASLFSLNWIFFSFWNHFWQRLCIHSLFSLLFLTFYGGPLSVSLLSADIKVTQLSRPSTFKCRAEPAAAPAADFRFYCADMEERKDYLWSEELMRRFYLQSESFCNLLDKRASEQSAMS